MVDNKAATHGGAVYIDASSSLRVDSHSNFRANYVANSGGAVFTAGAANITDASFVANAVTGDALGAGHGGAIAFAQVRAPTLRCHKPSTVLLCHACHA